MLSECAWTSASSQTFSNAAHGDNKVTFSLLWDKDAFYVGASVVDLQTEAGSGKLYQDDGLELFFNPMRETTTAVDAGAYHYIINILGDVAGAVQSATVTTESGYTMEVRIPWTALEMTPSQGRIVGMLLGNNDRDNDANEQFDWTQLIDTGSYYRPELWGDVTLAGALQCQEKPTVDCDSANNDCGGDIVVDDTKPGASVCPENHIVVNPEGQHPDELTVVVQDKDGNPVTCARIDADLAALGCSGSGGAPMLAMVLLLALPRFRRTTMRS
ncbi:MAG: sugar-binding protein [Myxococcota bacterium]